MPVQGALKQSTKRESADGLTDQHHFRMQVTGKSSSADEGVLVLQGDLDESIKEEYLSWDRPFTATAITNFYVEKGSPLFGFGEGILDDYNMYFRFFYQSGKRYTPASFTGTYTSQGRPVYEFSEKTGIADLGNDWFWVDMNFEKYFQ
jgi:hypothetical protein